MMTIPKRDFCTRPDTCVGRVVAHLIDAGPGSEISRDEVAKFIDMPTKEVHNRLFNALCAGVMSRREDADGMAYYSIAEGVLVTIGEGSHRSIRMSMHSDVEEVNQIITRAIDHPIKTAPGPASVFHLGGCLK
jgi:hypothetical protein